MTLGEVISNYRKTHSMSMDKFAGASGLSKAYISILERNRTTRGSVPVPSIDTFRAVAKAVGMDVDELIRAVDDKIRLGAEATAPESDPSGAVVRLDIDLPPPFLTGDLGDGETSFPKISERGAGKSSLVNAVFDGEAEKIARRFMDLDDHGKGAVRAILDFEEAALVAERRQNQKKAKPVKPRSDGFTDVKVFDQPAAAGLGNYLSDPIYHIEQYPANEVPDGTEFGVRISGLSMSPTIPNRATAFVQSRGAIEPGKIGIFLLNEEAYCKKLVVDREKQEIRLVSFNPEYEDRIIEDADVFSTMGLVLGWWPHN